ncbi:hypothetical protein ACLOJK_039765, partial [Asimina triloba]
EEEDEVASQDCGFFRWLDDKTTAETSLHSEDEKVFVQQPEIYADIEELISCVTQLKEVNQTAMTQMKEKHDKEIRQLKEANWKNELELMYISRKMDIHTATAAAVHPLIEDIVNVPSIAGPKIKMLDYHTMNLTGVES